MFYSSICYKKIKIHTERECWIDLFKTMVDGVQCACKHIEHPSCINASEVIKEDESEKIEGKKK